MHVTHAIILKFKMRWFPDEASYWAEKLYTDINIAHFMPEEDRNGGVSLVLDFRTWWRQVQAIFLFQVQNPDK